MVNPSSNVSSGMSRAAKKRAKKKQKHHQPEPQDLDNFGDGEEDSPPKKKSKQLLNHKQNAEQPPAPSAAQILEDEPDDPGMTIPDEPNDEVDQIVQDLVSKLTPSQILLLSQVDNPKRKVGDEKVDIRDLLNEITAQERAKCLFQSILGEDITVKKFYEKYWEKEPLVLQPNKKERFQGFLSLESIRSLIKTHPMAYGRDLNVTRYEKGVDGVKRRITLDQIGGEDDFVRVESRDLWSNFDSGCTIRLLRPHEHSDETHALLSTLELEWGCMVGSNAYLTPAGASQGFSPHYDDICAYILQLEGKKHWKVYAPLNKRETLPRASSEDYTEDDLKGIEPVLDIVLEAGDLLYMPRGWIHQACTLPTNEHSLHLTVSAMQQWAWADYLEILIPEALEAAAGSETSTSLREGLPRNFLEYMGAVHDQPEDPDSLKEFAKHRKEEEDDDATKRRRLEKDKLRRLFTEEAKKRILRVTKEAISMIDAACDQIGKRFLSDRLPPALTEAETKLTSDNRAETGGKIWPNTMCRLVRPGVARLVLEEGKAILYHCIDNARVYQGNPLSPLEFELDDAPAIEALLTTVEPHWIMVQDLIHDDIEDKMEIAQALYDEGILSIVQTEKPDKSVQTK